MHITWVFQMGRHLLGNSTTVIHSWNALHWLYVVHNKKPSKALQQFPFSTAGKFWMKFFFWIEEGQKSIQPSASAKWEIISKRRNINFVKNYYLVKVNTKSFRWLLALFREKKIYENMANRTQWTFIDAVLTSNETLEPNNGCLRKFNREGSGE